MRKSIEMKKELEAMRKTIDELQAKGEVGEAYSKLTAFKDLKKSIEVQEMLEESEAKNFGGSPVPAAPVQNTAEMRNRVFNKLVLGRPLTDIDNQVISMAAGTPGQVEATDAKGGYLVPVEQLPRLAEFRRRYLQLKSYCEIIKVNSKSGTFPTHTDGTDSLIDFDELNSITEGDITFGQIAYATHDCGIIIPVSNSLLEDENFDILGYIGTDFARRAANKENAKIIDLMDNLSAVAGTTYKDIKTALNVTLDGSYKNGSKIYTNQDGFNYLDCLTETGGKPILQPILTDPTKMMMSGCEIVVATNSQMATVSNAIPFYVGSMFDYIKFFDRLALAVAMSTEAGFTKNATLLRAIERFDAQVGDSAALVRLAITPA